MIGDSNYKELYLQFSKGNFKLGEIRSHLIRQNYQDNEIDDLISRYISDKNSLRTQRGLVFFMAGGGFLLTSMSLTFFNILPHLRGFILFGLTGIGICIVVFGLYLLFEKERMD